MDDQREDMRGLATVTSSTPQGVPLDVNYLSGGAMMKSGDNTFSLNSYNYLSLKNEIFNIFFVLSPILKSSDALIPTSHNIVPPA